MGIPKYKELWLDGADARNILAKDYGSTQHPANHGKVWTECDVDDLTDLFRKGYSLEEIAKALRRKNTPTLTKLCTHGLLLRKEAMQTTNRYFPSEILYDYYVAIKDDSGEGFVEKGYEMLKNIVGNNINQKEQETMNKTIENITLINDTKADKLSDDQIFDLIAKLEGDAQRLDKIVNKPKKLAEKIETIHEDIKKLVEYVDQR